MSEGTSADTLEIWVDVESHRVVLVGELDYRGASSVAEAIVTTDARTVDCYDLTYLDARGFEHLRDAHRQIEDGGGHISLVGLNGMPLRVARQLDAAGELHLISTHRSAPEIDPQLPRAIMTICVQMDARHKSQTATSRR